MFIRKRAEISMYVRKPKLFCPFLSAFTPISLKEGDVSNNFLLTCKAETHPVWELSRAIKHEHGGSCRLRLLEQASEICFTTLDSRSIEEGQTPAS
jgi:hypothetical protein